MSARPDLPAHHPQNVPLSKWTDGWLKLSVANHVPQEHYIMMHDHEKQAAGLPVTREQMIHMLTELGDIPAAGV